MKLVIDVPDKTYEWCKTSATLDNVKCSSDTYVIAQGTPMPEFLESIFDYMSKHYKGLTATEWYSTKELVMGAYTTMVKAERRRKKNECKS